ncbi:glycosyltransferase family 39 protein [Streptomyces sp. NPDC003691]
MLDIAGPPRAPSALRRPTAPAPPARPTGTWRIAVPPAVLMLALGLWGLEREGTLWADEAVTYDMALRTVAEILRTTDSADAVHGLYYLLVHGVFTVWEPGLVPMRLPSVLAMCATAAGVAAIGRLLAGPRAGLLAGLVLPVLPMVQRYAQEGRSYALVCACVTWGTWLLLRRRWTAYAAVMLFACLLHEFAVLALAAHGVTLWLGARPNALPGPEGRAAAVFHALPRGWRIAAAVVSLGLAPLAGISMAQSQQVDWIAFPSNPDLILIALGAVLARLSLRSPALAAVAPVAVPILVLPTALLLAVSLFDPLFVSRYVLFYAVGAALLLGAVLDRHWSRALVLATAAASVVVLVGHGPYERTPAARSDNVGRVAAAIAAASEPGDGVLFTPYRRRSNILVHSSSVDGLRDVSLAAGPRASDTLFGAELPPDRIRSRMLAMDRIVAVQDHRGKPVDPFPGEAVKREVLESEFTLREERTVGRVRIGVYVRTERVR